MKNVIKAVKKLKLWSRKKRKKKSHHDPYYLPPPPYPPPPPPPPRHCCCCGQAQPSAPPLPSWLEAEADQKNNYGTFWAPSAQPHQPMPKPIPQEIVVDPTPPTLPVTCATSSSYQYQQYMVPVSDSEPVYGIGMPVIEFERDRRRERSRGQFGCVFSFGARLFRCLCPCFPIRELEL